MSTNLPWEYYRPPVAGFYWWQRSENHGADIVSLYWDDKTQSWAWDSLSGGTFTDKRVESLGWRSRWYGPIPMPWISEPWIVPASGQETKSSGYNIKETKTNDETRFEQGKRLADLDWEDNTVDIPVLRDQGPRGQGYRHRRSELRSRR